LLLEGNLHEGEIVHVSSGLDGLSINGRMEEAA
jgi:hypothetical protein